MKLDANLRLLTFLLATFVAGLLVGWMVLGWRVFPPAPQDARPEELEASARVDYLAMVADSYATNGDWSLALSRLDGFDKEQVDEAIRRLASSDHHEQATILRALQQTRAQATVQAGTPPQATRAGPSLAVPTVEPTPVAAAGAAPPSFFDRLRLACGAFLLVLLIAAGMILAPRFLNRVTRQPPGMPVPAPPPSATTSPFPVRRSVDAGQVIRVTYQPGEPGYSREFLIYNSRGDRLGAWQLQIPRDAAAADLGAAAGLELLLTDRREGITVRKRLVAAPDGLPDSGAETGSITAETVPVQKGSVVELAAGELLLQAKVADLVYERIGVSGGGRLERLALEVVVDQAPEDETEDEDAADTDTEVDSPGGDGDEDSDGSAA